MKKLEAKITLRKGLEGQLTEEHQALLNTYLDLEGETDSGFCLRRFVYGFHLGALVMEELCQGRNALLQIN